MDKSNICIVAAEAVPFVKVGGMADVVGALYKYLKNRHTVSLFLPFYKTIRENYRVEAIGDIDVSFSENRREKALLAASPDYPGVYFIGHEGFFNREGLYGEEGSDYPDNAERFSFFAKGVLESVKTLGMNPQVFHCHDWHTALLPLYLKESYGEIYPDAKTLFTIHNLGYQGIFPAEKFHILGIPREYFSPEELEFYGDINFMKAGIIHAGSINTVSPKYSQEILTEDFGHRLEGLLKKHKYKLEGILNGIDYMIWNPSFDGLIAKKYRTYKTKGLNKTALQKELGLEKSADIPLFGSVTRLAEQKGIDELTDILEKAIEQKAQIVVLGDGSPVYKEALLAFGKKYPDRVSVNFGFNEKLAHRIYAGSDFFLMPSKFEPCGLGQMISFKYGTVPVVRNVGGLADTVKNYDFNTGQGTGFVFEGGSKDLLSCLYSALKLFDNKKEMSSLSEKIMKLDFSDRKSVV